jgi:O-antigen ligase
MKIRSQDLFNVVDAHIKAIFFGGAAGFVDEKLPRSVWLCFKFSGLLFVLAAICLPIKNSLTLTAICLGSFFSVISIAGVFFSRRKNIGSDFKQLVKMPIMLSALLLFCLIAVSYSYSDATQKLRFKYILSYRELVFMPLIMVAFCRFKQYQRSALMAFMIVMLGVVLLSVCSYFYPLGFANAVKDGAIKDSYITHSHIIQNVFAALLAMLVFVLIRHQKVFSLSWCVLCLILLLIVVDILFLVRGRTGQIVLMAELSVCFLSYGSKKVKIYAVIILTCVALLLFNFDNAFKDSFSRTNNEIVAFQKTGLDTSAGLRIAFWKYTLAEIKKSPLLGHGAGMYWKQYTLVAENPDKPGYSAGLNHPHNEFLFIWHNAGLLALLLYISLISALLWQAFKTSNKDLQAVRLSIAVGLIIYSLVDVPFYNSAEGMFYALMIGLFFDLKTPKNDGSVSGGQLNR